VAILLMAGSASAVTTTAVVCVPEKSSQPVLSPDNEGTCLKNSSTKYKEIVIGRPGPEGKQGKEGPAGKEGKEGPPGKDGKEGKEGKAGTSLLSEAEQTTLKEVLPCIKFVAKGVDEKPTVQFSGCNVQIVNGMGSTATENGAGNLVVGYDENTGAQRGHPGAQTGSHNLILGSEQEYTSFAGILTGVENSAQEAWAVIAGSQNTVSGQFSTITGGKGGEVSGEWGSITGGLANTVSSSSLYGVVSGGEENKSSGLLGAWVGGGRKNTAEASRSSVFGSKELTATKEYEAIP
jgi:hypothetical protein